MTLHNAPPSHATVIVVALILNAVILYAVVFALLVIRAGRGGDES